MWYFLAMWLFLPGQLEAGGSTPDFNMIGIIKPDQDSVKAKELLLLAVEHSRSDVPKAKKILYELRSFIHEMEDPKRMSGVYTLLTQLHQNTGLYDSALYYLNQNSLLRQQFPEDNLINVNYTQSAGLFYKNQGKFKEALNYLFEALEYISKTSDSQAKAGQLLNIGNCYSNMGDLISAADYHLSALREFEKLGNKRGQSFCYQGLGNNFYSLKQYAKAEEYLKKSLALKEELGDHRGLVSAKLSLGKVYSELSKFELAEQNFKAAEIKAQEMKLGLEESRIGHEIGMLYKRTNRPKLANAAFLKSQKIAELAGDQVLIALNESELQSLQSADSGDSLSDSSYIKRIEATQLSGNKRAALAMFEDLVGYYESTKQHDKALTALKEYHALKDSLEGSEALVQLQQLEELYLSEKREQEITLLKKEKELQLLTISRQQSSNTLIIIALVSVVIISLLVLNRFKIVNQSKRLIEIEKMRNTVARDLHDDLGSTLSSINILSQLVLSESNGHVKDYFQRIRDHSSKMMESLSDIVWSINPNYDSLEEVMIKIKEFAVEILEPKNITYSFAFIDGMDHIKLDAEQRKNIFLIFKEAINNAAKYSEGSLVSFQVAVKEGFIEFSLSDNGRGFEREAMKAGNGLRNMEVRAKDILGKIKYETQSGKGTSVTLAVPLT